MGERVGHFEFGHGHRRGAPVLATITAEAIEFFRAELRA